MLKRFKLNWGAGVYLALNITPRQLCVALLWRPAAFKGYYLLSMICNGKWSTDRAGTGNGCLSTVHA